MPVLVPVPMPVPVPEVEADDLGPTLARGEAVLVAVAGFLAAAVVAAVELLFTRLGDPVVAEPVVLFAAETRRAAPVAEVVEPRGFFSSSDTDGCERCVEVEVAVGGRFVAVVPAGRVGGLLKPPLAAVRAVEVAAGLVAAEVVPAVPAGRRAVVPGATVRFVAVLADAFAPVVPLAAVGAGAVSGSAGGASVCWITSNPSASDMMG